MQKTHLALFFFGSAALLVFAPRCSSSPQDCTQTSTCPQEGGDGPPPLVCDMTKDPKDDTGCIDDRVGVFVSPTGSDSNAGTKAAPFQTIGKALASVGTLTRVYVCEGTYAEDVAIAPPVDGISIYGGFKCSDWSYSGNKPTIGKGTLPLKITGTTKPLTLEDVVIQAADGDSTSPSSIAALVANASGAVTFSRANLTAGKGANGADGAAGNNYNASLLQNDPSIAGNSATGGGTKNGGAQLCANLCADGKAATGGAGGVGGTSTQGGASGSATPALTGTPPNDGAGGAGGAVCTSGDNGATATVAGADATSATALGTLDANGWTATAAAGGKNGGTGQGGGGGGGATFADNSAGGGGGGGCGGCGGGGGMAGGSGGSSIALAVVSSPVTLTASELHATNGGSGGKGGAGQAGQSGGFKGKGSTPGCDGGNGGNGSAGGSGAGGVGGLSVGVLYTGAAPTIDAGTTAAITVGNPGAKGTGGTAGANDGKDGVAQPTMQAP